MKIFPLLRNEKTTILTHQPYITSIKENNNIPMKPFVSYDTKSFKTFESRVSKDYNIGEVILKEIELTLFFVMQNRSNWNIIINQDMYDAFVDFFVDRICKSTMYYYPKLQTNNLINLSHLNVMSVENNTITFVQDRIVYKFIASGVCSDFVELFGDIIINQITMIDYDIISHIDGMGIDLGLHIPNIKTKTMDSNFIEISKP